MLLKAIIAVAYRGYFEGTEAKEFVQFIVKHCCPQPVPNVSLHSFLEDNYFYLVCNIPDKLQNLIL